MKKFCVFAAVAVLILVSSCYSDDDGFSGNRSVWLQINDAITIDNQENYIVGDTIVFELRFSRLLAEEGFDNPLDIFETTNADEFGFQFEIEKYSEFSERFENIFIGEEFILGTRIDEADFSFSRGTLAATLDDSRQTYSATVGVVLPETGRFNLALNGMRIDSPYAFNSPNVIQVSIEHQFSAGSTVITEFVVAEE